jgi:hypothetical protein
MLCRDRRAYSAHAFAKNGMSEHFFETAEVVLRRSDQTGEQTGEIVRADCALGRVASLTKLYSRKYTSACRCGRYHCGVVNLGQTKNRLRDSWTAGQLESLKPE